MRDAVREAAGTVLVTAGIGAVIVGNIAAQTPGILGRRMLRAVGARTSCWHCAGKGTAAGRNCEFCNAVCW